jgi:hypothetical protein
LFLSLTQKKIGKYLSGQFGGFSQTGFNLFQMKQIANVTGQTLDQSSLK